MDYYSACKSFFACKELNQQVNGIPSFTCLNKYPTLLLNLICYINSFPSSFPPIVVLVVFLHFYTICHINSFSTFFHKLQYLFLPYSAISFCRIFSSNLPCIFFPISLLMQTFISLSFCCLLWYVAIIKGLTIPFPLQ